MTLKQLILENNLQDLTAAEIVVALNEPTEERTRDTPIGPAGLYKLAGAQVAGAVSAVLSAAAAQNAFIADIQRTYAAYGLVLSDSDTRDQIDLIFTGDYASVGTALKSLGIWQISKAEAANLGTVTEQQATAALAQIATDNLDIIHSQLTAEVINEVFNAHKFSTMAELKAAVAAYGV